MDSVTGLGTLKFLKISLIIWIKIGEIFIV